MLYSILRTVAMPLRYCTVVSGSVCNMQCLLSSAHLLCSDKSSWTRFAAQFTPGSSSTCNCAAGANSHPKNLHPRISSSLLYVVCIYNSYTAYLYCTKCTIPTECGACLHQNLCCSCGACGARSSDGWWRRACMQLATQRGPAFGAPRQREQPSLT